MKQYIILEGNFSWLLNYFTRFICEWTEGKELKIFFFRDSWCFALSCHRRKVGGMPTPLRLRRVPFCRASWRAKDISPVVGMLRFAPAWKSGNEIWDEKLLWQLSLESAAMLRSAPVMRVCPLKVYRNAPCGSGLNQVREQAWNHLRSYSTGPSEW